MDFNVSRQTSALAADSGARLDAALATAAVFESRAKAREAIEAGLVTVDGAVVRKPAARVREGATLAASAVYPWVSRGGVKLAAGLDSFGFDPNDRVCLDVGASTGGFTDVLLARGAAHVSALDVGHGQLHPRIAADPRVTDWSGTDIRAITPARFPDRPSLITCDVSFISLRHVLPIALALAADRSELVALVKPQFEVGRGHVHKGLVRDETLRRSACDAVQGLVEALGWRVAGIMPSPITGGDGNVEYLLGAQRP